MKVSVSILLFWVSLSSVLGLFVSANNPISVEEVFKKNKTEKPLSFNQKQTIWVDSLLASMSLEEKIGQLFMVAAYSNRNEVDYRKLEGQIEKYHIGGIIFFQGNPLKQAELTNRYQEVSKYPLMIGIDGEWGLGMRLDDAYSFPKAITLGATSDPILVEKIGYEIGKQCKRLGVHINFAPDADINSNPKNPVINFRSFGESVSNVSNLALAYSRGLKKAKVMGSAKHFPGHGDTGTDSHYALPVLNHSLKHINEVESMPFRALIEDSVASVMIGHLHVPSLDDSQNTPASVSEKVINGFLKKQLNFKGLVVTDALNMRGLLKYYPIGEAEVKAFQAGNDLLLQTGNLDIAFNSLHKKFLDSTLSITDLDYKVRKILMSKYWAGLNKVKSVELRNLISDLNNNPSKDLTQKVFNEATTIVKDDDGLIPLPVVSKLKYASIAIAGKVGNDFQETLSYYSKIENHTMPFKPSSPNDWKWVVDEASKSDLVIVSVHEMHNLDKKDFGVVPETLEMIRTLQEKTKVIVCVFGNPYSLKLFDEFETVICGFEDESAAHIAMANIIFGVDGASGTIPVNTLSIDGKVNFGISTKPLNRIGFGIPSEVGMDQAKLEKISNLVQNSIANQEFPGCQIYVARKGKVVYYKSFGNQRYGYDEPINGNTIYDLASLTKVSATLQAIMMLYDQKKLNIEAKASIYLPELLNSNKKDITIRDLLLHQAGLKSFVPFYEKTKTNNTGLNPFYFKNENTDKSWLDVCPNLCVNPTIKDSLFQWIKDSPLSTSSTKRYLYSDLGLIVLQRIVEKITDQSLDVYVGANIYKPLGLHNTAFNILKFGDNPNIAPTEMVNDYRSALLKGTVHDPNAALLGGVSGHAGLFSTAWELGTLFQMNLNNGTYDGHQFFSPKTIELFSSSQSTISHRGLGWNKPTKNDASVSEYASSKTFGHTGFTGTVAWVDPENDLVFVFLANRVYPSADNTKIIKNKTRKRIHDLVYEAIVD
ncbi:glycoside hydrolase [Lacihabitans sp. LS3-19]|uniref:glycoside hydrolase family 3 N-terminal domain-containing protein n=1 Tax=Lacihabitans sp. LS3-19 TaxID=2487335 RepID=UPI0020CD5FEE|nr:glycoside hydrolase family 3 N-terminal domain-containing protein [Lacihabitans sp. LS3-19]MCP9766329.1 glycoside hydrolase [Lacihabitans sp. LS3-19]